MFERILRFAIEQRWLVLLAVLGMAGVGVYSYQRLPIDAVPDITNVQVQINAAVPGASPLETEQRVTFPIETAMAGLPHLRQTRSLSRSGFAQITVIFDDGTDLYFARQLVSERLQAASNELPQGVEVTLGPISTGLGKSSSGRSRPSPRRAVLMVSPTRRPTCVKSGLDHQAAAAETFEALPRSTRSVASPKSIR